MEGGGGEETSTTIFSDALFYCVQGVFGVAYFDFAVRFDFISP